MRRIGTAALAAAILACVAATPAQAAFPGGNGKVAFWDSGLFTINPDGSARTAFPPIMGWAFAWSPDGTQIATQRVDGVQVSNGDGSGIQTVYDLGTVIEAIDWSPDGSQIVAWDHVIDSAEGDSASLVVFNADGSFPYLLIDPGTVGAQ